MSLTQIVAEERRLKMLEALNEMDERRLADGTLLTVLDHIGIPVDRDLVRADLEFLARHALVTVERLAGARGEVWVASLTEEGGRVMRGRPHPGIKRGGGR